MNCQYPLNILSQDLEVERYGFVEASAGTGKTFAIEHLAVRLVLAGIPIDRILLMTFTKAAKTELIRRIHGRLKLCLLALENGSTDTPYLIPYRNSKGKARLLRAALQTFHEAKITTIHGFCQALLSKYAFESEISMALPKSPGGEGQLENIRSYLQGHLRPSDISSLQLEIALKSCGGKVERLFEAISGLSITALGESPLPFQDLCDKINAAFRSIGSLDEEKIAADFEALKRHYNGFNPCRDQPQLLARFLERGATREEIEDAIEWKVCFWDLVNKENHNKVSLKKNEPLLLHYPFLAKGLQKEITPLFTRLKAPSSIIGMLALKFHQFKESFVGTVETPDDLLFAMRRAVEKPRFLSSVRKEFDAAVIDEFQDTDALQWEIFERLFLEQKPLKALYLVGDPKQSIYAFRHADLYSYLRAREWFAQEERMYLSVNFRAEKSLTRTLNTLFSQENRPSWMPLPRSKSFLEVASVQPAEGAEENSLEDCFGSVHFWLLESTSNMRGTFAHAELDKKQLIPSLVTEILRLQEMKLFPLSHMAILVKDRHQAKNLMEELTRFGIATVFVRSESIATSPVFSTMLALLRALDAPYGLYELKRFLMSPIVNCSKEEMMAVLEGGGLQEFLAQMRSLKECYHMRGLGACLQKSLALELPDHTTLLAKLFPDVEATFYTDFLQIEEIILEECSLGKRSLPQLITFLEEISWKNPDENKQIQRQAQITEDTVVVMTMHASKGLEFDVVFAVGLGLRTLHRETQDPEEKDAEKMRLLYVAMTRAKRRLYIPLVIDQKQLPFKAGVASPSELFCARWVSPNPSSYKDWLEAGSSLTLDFLMEHLSCIQKQCSISWEVLREKPIPPLRTKACDHPTLPKQRPFTPFWRKRELLSFSSLFRPTKLNNHLKPTLEKGHLPLGAETGNLVHGLMEIIFRQGVHHPLREEKIRALIEEMTLATSFEVYGEQLLALVLSSLRLPLTPMQPGYSPFALCDVSPSDLFAEMEFCFSHKEGMYKGFIDLVFLHEGLYYIVDWKTNWLSDYGPKERHEAMEQHGYRIQAGLYTQALARYVKLFDIRPFSSSFGGAHYLFLRGEKWESFMP